ncbi:MAG: S41 family peptidase [Candidatus Obscuribacterales bacterium]|nr:S41 family peptidase [Candidatus Obscuribacterales bacterium]
MKKLLLTLLLTTSLVTTGAFAQARSPVDGTSESNTVAPDEGPASKGRQLYGYYFERFYRDLFLFGDDGQAREFKNTWEHKFDDGDELDSPIGSKAAIDELVKVGSLIGCSEKFDGACLYRRAFRAYTKFHYHPADGTPNLVDPVERAKWASEWEHKFDASPDLLTEVGADSAIRKMRDSLGQRFDYVYSQTQTKSERDTIRANFAGIGVPITLTNDETMKLGAPIELLAHEPPANSPAFGLVHYGDVIVKVGGKPVSEMTNKEALQASLGPIGSHQSLTVRRKAKNGGVVFLNFDIVRAHVMAPLAKTAPTGDATIGIPVQLINTEKLKLGGESYLLAGEPFDNGPAKGKLHEGDVIVAADGVSFDGMTMNEAVDKIRGPAGTRVALTVRAKGDTATKQVLVTRRTIEKHAVHYTALPKDIGYIKVDQFMSQNVPDDYAAAVARTVLPLVSQKLAENMDALSQAKVAEFNALKRILDHNGALTEQTLPIAAEAAKLYDELGVIGGGIIIDLDDDPGGDLQVFHTLASMSLLQGTIYATPKRDPGTDQIIVHEEVLMPDFETIFNHPLGTGPKKSDVQTAARRPLLIPATMPLMVLVNGESASASELFSGMMQANRRALIIGESTVGKGVGQTVIDLPYGRSLHVTTFEFLPGGMKSDWTGVIVDKAVSPVHGKNNAQVDAAVAEIDQANARARARIDAAATSLKLHQQFFGADMKERESEDNKPIGEQDNILLH